MKWIFTHCKSMEAHEESCNEAMNQTPRSDYFPWQYIKVATRDVMAVRRLAMNHIGENQN